MDDENNNRRLIRHTLMKVQNPNIRKRYLDILTTQSDMGKPVEWQSPLMLGIMRGTIEVYEQDFEAQKLETDEQLNKMIDAIYDKLFSSSS